MFHFSLLTELSPASQSLTTGARRIGQISSIVKNSRTRGTIPQIQYARASAASDSIFVVKKWNQIFPMEFCIDRNTVGGSIVYIVRALLIPYLEFSTICIGFSVYDCITLGTRIGSICWISRICTVIVYDDAMPNGLGRYIFITFLLSVRSFKEWVMPPDCSSMVSQPLIL